MPNERLIHYSRKPLTAVRSKSQTPPERHDKPNGLWVSVEGDSDWLSWCLCAQQIVLAEDARILRISGVAALDEFHEEYMFSPYPGVPFVSAIRWDLVAERYQGIVIAPYLWERRLVSEGARGYYSWGASGCIWDQAAVAAIVPIAPPDLATQAADEEVTA